MKGHKLVYDYVGIKNTKSNIPVEIRMRQYKYWFASYYIKDKGGRSSSIR